MMNPRIISTINNENTAKPNIRRHAPVNCVQLLLIAHVLVAITKKALEAPVYQLSEHTRMIFPSVTIFWLCQSHFKSKNNV